MDETKAGQEAGAAAAPKSKRLLAAEAFVDACEIAGRLATTIGYRGRLTLDGEHGRNLLMAHGVRARWLETERAYHHAQNLLHEALLEDGECSWEQPARPAPPTGSASMAGKEK